MGATPEQLEWARKKALESPLIGKRGKGRKTIEREKRQEIFDEIVSQKFEEIIEQAKPEYKLDRFLGKVPDKVEVTGVIVSRPSAEAVQAAEESIKQKLIEGNNE